MTKEDVMRRGGIEQARSDQRLRGWSEGAKARIAASDAVPQVPVREAESEDLVSRHHRSSWEQVRATEREHPTPTGPDPKDGGFFVPRDVAFVLFIAPRVWHRGHRLHRQRFRRTNWYSWDGWMGVRRVGQQSRRKSA